MAYTLFQLLDSPSGWGWFALPFPGPTLLTNRPEGLSNR